MFRPRIIPALLLHNKGFVKTRKFKNPVYIGDPINTIKIFNEKEVDEIVIYDIDATAIGREPDYEHIANIVSEAFFPICFGGGVKNIKQMEKIFRLGVEKISVSSQAVFNIDLVKESSTIFGNQAIVATLDYKKTFLKKDRIIYTHNGKRSTGIYLKEMVKKLTDNGIGEIILNSIDRDGTRKGYDLEYIKEVTAITNVPVVALGGAKNLNDMRYIVENCGASAAAAGSLFVFYGKRNAVLINYPTEDEFNAIFS